MPSSFERALLGEPVLALASLPGQNAREPRAAELTDSRTATTLADGAGSAAKSQAHHARGAVGCKVRIWQLGAEVKIP